MSECPYPTEHWTAGGGGGGGGGVDIEDEGGEADDNDDDVQQWAVSSSVYGQGADKNK